MIRWKNRIVVLLHDMLFVPVAWFGAYWLRFNLDVIPTVTLMRASEVLPVVLALQSGAFVWFGLYRGVWRFASLPDLMRILKAVLSGALLIIAALSMLSRLEGVPRSVIPLYALLLISCLGFNRFAFRWLKDSRLIPLRAQRVLIVGVGRDAESLARDLMHTGGHRYVPVAFVDEQEKNKGREIYGVRILGQWQDIPRIVSEYGIDQILIALPHAKAVDMRRVMHFCQPTGRPIRMLPAVGDLVTGRVSVQHLREVQLDDLLGRDPAFLDHEMIAHTLAGQVVMVTGGGGSIGAELCRQIICHAPKAVCIIDNSEYNLFILERELRVVAEKQKILLFFHLGSICDVGAMRRLVRMYRPRVIYHAAAYKHVPILESHVREAFYNNVIGTTHMATIAFTEGVDKFVLVSSDKAVNPTNVMGATKRVAERICCYLNQQQKTKFITVRFGNVLGSRGSVVEIFKAQLQAGGPITITHPDMTRFFMTIPEASQLILQASAMGEGGEIFVLDMGEPVKIQFLAEQMIRLAGRQVGEDIDITYVGLRPGEKLAEELLHEKESLVPTPHRQILQVRARTEEATLWEEYLAVITEACNSYDEPALRAILLTLVPEFHQDIQKKQIEMA